MAYGTALLVVQTAVYGVLSADGTLTGRPCAVYDRILTNVAFPYIALGDQATESVHDTFSKQAVDEVFTLNIWSRFGGWSEALAILGDCNRLLHRQQLTLTGGVWTMVHMKYKTSQMLKDPDGLSRRIRVQYDVMAEEL